MTNHVQHRLRDFHFRKSSHRTSRYPNSSYLQDLRTRLLLAAMLGLAALALSACRPQEPQPSQSPQQGDTATDEAQDGLRVRVEFDTTTVGPAPATVHVLDGSAGVTGADVELQGDMSHAGMQPVLATAVESEPGVYRAEEFAFAMAGDWFVTASVETVDGREAKLETFVTVSSR